MLSKRIGVVLVGLVLTATPLAVAQVKETAAGPGKVLVSIFHVAPGKHLDFLKWQAAYEAVDKEAGLSIGQWYVHTDGDSWDFVSIVAQRTPAEDKKVEDLLKKKGLKTGFASALEFRQFVSSHTDTFALGPQSAADLVKAATGN